MDFPEASEILWKDTYFFAIISPKKATFDAEVDGNGLTFPATKATFVDVQSVELAQATKVPHGVNRHQDRWRCEWKSARAPFNSTIKWLKP